MSTYILNNLKALRKRAGLKQQELATKSGLIAFDPISRWERGLSYSSVENLDKLCRLFNVHYTDIYPDQFTPTPHHAEQYTQVFPASVQDGAFESHQSPLL